MLYQMADGISDEDFATKRCFEGAAQLLGTSLDPLSEGRIPYRRLGRRRVFIKAELETWLSLLPGVSVADALAAQHTQTAAITRRRRHPAAFQATA